MPPKKLFIVFYKETQNSKGIKKGDVEFEVAPGVRMRKQVQAAFEEKYGKDAVLCGVLDSEGISDSTAG